MPLLAPKPPAPPPVTPAQSNWGHVGMTWTGWDASVWDLLDWQSGVFLTNAGVSGLLMPVVDPYTTMSPAVDGSTWRGSRTEDRDVFWPLFLYSSTSDADWLALDRAFWATMRPDQLGVWTVTAPDGSARSLQLRYAGMDDDTVTRAPMRTGWQTYGVSLTANQPYWLGPLSYRRFGTGEQVKFFDPDGSPPFHISPGSTLALANIDNPGDLEAPLVYVLEGPWDTGASVAVGSSAATVYNASIPSGTSVVIDTRVEHLGAWSLSTPTAKGGTPDWWAEVSAASTSVFSNLGNVALNVKVQPGRSRQLTVTATGTGTVHVALEPRYWRAW